MRVLEYVIATISVVFMLWVGISFVDVVADNTTNANHTNWNAFVIFTEMAK